MTDINIAAVLIIKACKNVVESAENVDRQPEDFKKAVYQLSCLMKDLKSWDKI